MKTAEQQGLQAIQRSRELLIGECTALSNHLRGILLEFGVVIPQGFASLLRALPECPTCTDRRCTACTSDYSNSGETSSR
jgi:transposase